MNCPFCNNKITDISKDIFYCSCKYKFNKYKFNSSLSSTNFYINNISYSIINTNQHNINHPFNTLYSYNESSGQFIFIAKIPLDFILSLESINLIITFS